MARAPEPAPYVRAGVDTRALPSASRLDLWRDHVVENHGRLGIEAAEPGQFVGRTRVQRLGRLQMVDFWSSAVAYTRPRGGFDDDRGDGDDSLRILLPTTGTIRITGVGGEGRISSGTAAVVSMRQGFRLEHDDRARALVVTCPQRLWGTAASGGFFVADLAQGTGAVVESMVRQAAEQSATLSGPGFAAVIEAAVGLLARGAPSSEDDLAVQARSLAHRHADDADFDPDELARRLGRSLRSAQYGLRRAGTTPASVIREVRLERAARRLRHPGWAERSVTTIAHASGFGSLSAFHSAFRAAHGQTPAHYRSTG